MRSSSMRMHNLQDIYNHKTQYQNHKRKLNKIYESRKSHLCYDNIRTRDFDHIKQNKAKSFINKFNQKSNEIASENIKLLGKLERVKTSLSRKSISEDRQKSCISYKPLVKRRITQTQKQNMRISARMKNMSSSLNQKSFMKDYEKSQKIKNRLMKYAPGSDRTSLKSERYFDDSHSNPGFQNKVLRSKRLQKNTFTSHYKREQIMKNKIDISTSSLAKIKLKNQKSDRPNTSFESGKGNGFFATEPRKSFLKVPKKFALKKYP